MHHRLRTQWIAALVIARKERTPKALRALREAERAYVDLFRITSMVTPSASFNLHRYRKNSKWLPSTYAAA